MGARAKVGLVGNDEQGRRVYQLSQSWLGTSEMCAEQARLAMLEQLPPTDTDATVRGTGVHAGIEYALHEKLAGQSIEYAIMREVCERSVRQDIEAMPWLEWKKHDGLPSLLHATDVMLATWLEKVEPKVKPAQIEWEFDVLLHEDDHRVIRLTGGIDCAAQDYGIWDWKTGDRYKARETWQYQRWATQPTAYAYAMDVTHNEWGNAGPWTFTYAALKESGEVEFIRVMRDQGHFDWLKRRAVAMVKLIEAELDTWPLGDNGWWCSSKWCPAWDDCKGATMSEGWDQTVKV